MLINSPGVFGLPLYVGEGGVREYSSLLGSDNHKSTNSVKLCSKCLAAGEGWFYESHWLVHTMQLLR